MKKQGESCIGKWTHPCASAAADIQLWKLHVQPVFFGHKNKSDFG